MGLEHLWAAWRSSYVNDVVASRSDPDDDESRTLFERLLDPELPEEEAFVVHRGDTCAVILNAYPYTNGHMLAMPIRAEPTLSGLDEREFSELWSLTRDAVGALEVGYGCEGVNVGLNLGSAGGAGLPDHLHVHVLPRWSGDTNFMTAVANTRVLPESLEESLPRLRDARPD